VAGIAIVSPGYPGQPGGVTDHTSRLRRRWASAGHDVIVLGRSVVTPTATVSEWAARGVSAALIQYVPFLYGRRGLSTFPERLARDTRAKGIRLTVFVHEPWVPPTRLPWLILSPLQRRQLRRLLAIADTVVTAVPAWVPLLGGEVTVVPVGSNLGTPPETTSARLRSPVVFSPFAAGLAWPWIVAAVEAIDARPPLVIVGADPAGMRRHPLTRRWYGEGWECRGYLEPRAALATLARAPVGLAPFVDGATCRRGSLLALLSTGVPVVTSRGHLYDPRFDRAPIAVASTREEFAALARATWERGDDPTGDASRRAWYDEELAPEKLDARLLAIVTEGTA
jgi:hypothetical protein